MSWEAGFKVNEIEPGFVLEPTNMDGLVGKWELDTYIDELGICHVRLNLEAAQDCEAWEVIRPGEEGVPLETLLLSE